MPLLIPALAGGTGLIAGLFVGGTLNKAIEMGLLVGGAYLIYKTR